MYKEREMELLINIIQIVIIHIHEETMYFLYILKKKSQGMFLFIQQLTWTLAIGKNSSIKSNIEVEDTHT